MAQSKEWHAQAPVWRAKEWHAKQSKKPEDEEDIYADEPVQQNKGFYQNLLDEIKSFKGQNALETAGNAAGAFNRGFEKYTGLPHAARGAVQGGENVLRGGANLIPGVNIPSAHFGEMPIGNGEENWLTSLMGNVGQAGAEILPFSKIQSALTQIPKIGKNIAPTALASAAISPDDRLLGGAIGAGFGAIPSLIKGGKAVYETAKRPYKALEETKNYIEKLKSSMGNRESNFSEAEKQTKRHIQEKNEENLMQEKNLEKKLADVYPILPKSETRENLVQQHENATKSLDAEFKQRYGNFSKEHGKKPIKTPMKFEDFLEKTKDLKGLSSTLQEMRVNPNKKIIRYESSHGKTKEIAIPKQGATVDEYTDFMREVRDASYDALNASKNATHAEKQDLLKTYRELKNLQNNVEKHIEETIGKEGFEPFRKIQSDYAGTVGRIKSEPSIANASYGKKISDAIFSDLLQPANKQLRKYLYKNPDYKAALREHLLQEGSHPVSTGAQFNPAKVNADVYHLLSNEQRAASAEANILGENKTNLKDVAQSIKNPETMTALQEKQAREFSPEVNEFLDRVAHEKHITKQMQQEAEKLGLDQKKFEEQIKTRKYIAAIIGAGTAFGIVPSFAKKLYHAIF